MRNTCTTAVPPRFVFAARARRQRPTFMFAKNGLEFILRRTREGGNEYVLNCPGCKVESRTGCLTTTGTSTSTQLFFGIDKVSSAFVHQDSTGKQFCAISNYLIVARGEPPSFSKILCLSEPHILSKKRRERRTLFSKFFFSYLFP